jgi:hypothetical protein
MKAKVSTLVLVGVLICCLAPMLPLSNLAAQTDQRELRYGQHLRASAASL